MIYRSLVARSSLSAPRSLAPPSLLFALSVLRPHDVERRRDDDRRAEEGRDRGHLREEEPPDRGGPHELGVPERRERGRVDEGEGFEEEVQEQVGARAEDGEKSELRAAHRDPAPRGRNRGDERREERGVEDHRPEGLLPDEDFVQNVQRRERAGAEQNLYHELSAQDCSVQLSGELKNLAVILMKVSNDLRWMNSGPLAGISDIELKALQPGSSIMPGKVNPVIPEAVAMASADVIGNDVTITVAAQSGSFQLNVMLPVIAYNLLKSINLLSGSMNVLSKKAIKTFKVNHKNLELSLSKNPILVTALNPIIGYEKAAAIAKKAYKENRPIIEVAAEETDLTESKLKKLLDPSKLAKGGI